MLSGEGGMTTKSITEVWEWQSGTRKSDRIDAVALTSDGSTVVAGTSNGFYYPNDVQWTWEITKLDVTGSGVWGRTYITVLTSDLNGVAVGEDESIVSAGAFYDDTVDGPSNSTVMKISADGSFMWDRQYETTGSTNRDIFYAVATAVDGSIFVAGTTTGNWSASNVGESDFAAGKLSSNDGTLLWKWQDGTAKNDRISAAVVGGDGTLTLAGFSEGNWTNTSAGSMDFIAVKLDANGTELWRWQDGTESDDQIRGAIVEDDGSIVLAGETAGNWSGTLTGGQCTDFAAVRLDINGSETWRWQGGTEEEDGLFAISAGEDGSTVLAGQTRGTWYGNASESDDLDFAVVKLGANGTELRRYQGGTSENDTLAAAATDILTGKIILAGATFGDWGAYNFGGSNGVVVMLGPETVSNEPESTPHDAARAAPISAWSASTLIFLCVLKAFVSSL